MLMTTQVGNLLRMQRQLHRARRHAKTVPPRGRTLGPRRFRRIRVP